MNSPASFPGSSIPLPSQYCSSCRDLSFFPSPPAWRTAHRKWSNLRLNHVSRSAFHGKREVVCRVTETETGPENDDDEKEGVHEDGEIASATDSISPVSDQSAGTRMFDSENPVNNNKEATKAQGGTKDGNYVHVASGSPLPGVKGGVLFKGNLRGLAAKSYEKIKKRMEDKLGDQYKLFLLINLEDDKPVAVVVPGKTLQPETPFRSTFDKLDLLKDGLPGALVTALILGVHEIGHIVVAKDTGVKLGVPYFIPSWQTGSFGAITRILNVIPKREDLLMVAAAGPLAGFSLGLVLLFLGFILPPSDGIGVIVDASVFHESLPAGGIAKFLLGDVLKEGTPISVNPLVVWAWAGLLINAINSIPAGELDGGRISFAIWGRKASARLTAASIVLLGLSSLLNDVAFYWVVLIFFLQRGPIAPISEEIKEPNKNYVALGVIVLLLGVLVCLPYPFVFTSEAITSF